MPSVRETDELDPEPSSHENSSRKGAVERSAKSQFGRGNLNGGLGPGKEASLYGFEQTAGQEAIYTHRSGTVRVGADHLHLHGRNLLSERWWIVPATGPRCSPY